MGFFVDYTGLHSALNTPLEVFESKIPKRSHNAISFLDGAIMGSQIHFADVLVVLRQVFFLMLGGGNI